MHWLPDRMQDQKTQVSLPAGDPRTPWVQNLTALGICTIAKQSDISMQDSGSEGMTQVMKIINPLLSFFKSLKNESQWTQQITTSFEYHGYLFKRVTTYWKEIRPASVEWFVNSVKVTHVGHYESEYSFALAYIPFDGRDSIDYLSIITPEEISRIKVLGNEFFLDNYPWYHQWEEIRDRNEEAEDHV